MSGLPRRHALGRGRHHLRELRGRPVRRLGGPVALRELPGGALPGSAPSPRSLLFFLSGVIRSAALAFFSCSRVLLANAALSQSLQCTFPFLSLCSSCFQPGSGGTACLACPEGNFCGAGETSVTACPAGYYCGAATSTPTHCSSGKFAAAGAAACQSCAGGTYQVCPQAPYLKKKKSVHLTKITII